MNRLGEETSPYLRQHADNPVHWYPWGDEAFADASATDRPILLSIGYSACHWCHVMAHESFENPAIAAVMNDLFVNVKVDREERPDVDAVYMEAIQRMTGRGGWPMTVFLTPDGRPFWGGTYFAPEPRGNIPGFADVLREIRRAWDEQRDDAENQADALTASLQQSADMRPAAALAEPAAVDRAVGVFRQQYDAAWGGFGTAPKFPQTMGHETLLRVSVRNNDDDLARMVTNSLDAMASGGIYDHLGGGFARYSTDNEWIVPHFEKMLYDNALLARLFLHAWQVSGKDRYLQVLDETLGYVLRDLRHPGGGFFAAEDADSEGEEGRYYLWTPAQIHAVLGDDAVEFTSWFGVTEQGNHEGRNILWRPVRGDLLRSATVELSRQRLLASREMRIRPGRDDKVLTEWNGLMLATLAEAAKVTSNQQWLEASVRNATFLLANLRRADGRWMRSWQDDGSGGKARHLGTAGDLAAMVDGLTRLGEASGERRWTDAAVETADQLVDLFWDDEHGGFHTTGSDADPLIVRPKDVIDNAIPSANASAAVALLRLGALTGNRRYRERAEVTARLVTDLVDRQPTAFGHLLYALDLLQQPMTEIVIPGDRPDLVDVVRLRFLPNAVLAWGEEFDSPLWEGRREGSAYVCEGFTCAAPATSAAELASQLEARR